MKLRSLLLIIFSVIAAVPLLLFWLWPHAQSLRNEMEDVRDRHLLIAETVGIALGNYHQEVAATFRLVRSNLVAQGRVARAEDLLEDLNFRTICLFDIESRQLALRMDRVDHRCPDSLDAGRHRFLADLAAQPRAASSAAPMSPVMAGADGAPVLYLAALHENLLAVGTLDTDFFVELAGAVAFGRKGYAMIVDQEGQLLAHPNEAWQQERRRFADLPVIERMRQGQAGVATFNAPSLGTEVIAGYTVVPGIGWGVIVAQPVEELRDRAARVSNSALIVVVIGLLTAALVSYLFAYYMTRPLRAVSQAVRRMAAGDSEARTRVSSGLLVPEELRELQKAFNAMAEALERSRRVEKEARLRAEEASRSKSAFLANMSHELRTPLNAVLGFTEVMLAETFGKIGSARYTEYLQDIRTSARHLLALINDLLDLSRIEAGAMKVEEHWFPLGEVLEESAAMFRDACAGNEVALRVELPDVPLTILADERALRQIFINLLSNAVRHTRAGGTVTLGAHAAENGSLAIFVVDTGIGIPAADLERVLQPFEQVARERRRPQEGTGLGLSIVKELVELHGGQLTLASEVGKGTTVTFTLPPERVQAGRPAPRAQAGV